ncbi:MAG: right-handed parallel beta-helix repeat-containing protein [Bryobacteraceae bacterium]|jgi:hypothetical protein
MNRRSFLTTGFAAGVAVNGLPAPGADAAGAEFYVAPSGKDSNAGDKASPFATIQRARDEVRKLVASGLKSNVTVWIHGGVYTLHDTVVFGLQDSGTDKYSITYEAVPGERPVFTSGVKIENWKRLEDSHEGYGYGFMIDELPVPAEGKVWVADVPESLGRFYTLYDKQGHLPRAQGHGFRPLNPPGYNPGARGQAAAAGAGGAVGAVGAAGAAGATGAGRGGDRMAGLMNLYFPEGALRNWSNIDDVDIVIRYSSTMNVLPLASVDETARVAHPVVPGTYGLDSTQGVLAGAGYRLKASAWVENVLDALGYPGAWVLNTHTRKLYLWPRTGKPEGITAPRLGELFRVEGKIDVEGPTDVPVRNVVFRGLTFTGADRVAWNANDSGMQHDWCMIDKPDALLRFRGAEGCKVQNCKFRDSGGSAIRLDLYAQKNRIEGNEIRYMGEHGVALLGYGAGTKDVNKNNEVLNNHIHHCGLLIWHSLGVVLWQSGSNHIANNYFHDMPRHAICLSGPRLSYFQAQQHGTSREIWKTMRWNELPNRPLTWDEATPFLLTRNNLIEYNEIERVALMLGDGAVINVSGCGQGDHIRRNYLHDIFTAEWVSGCLRTDDWQRGTIWEENVIYRSNSSAFCHKGANNIINNFAIDVLSSRAGYFMMSSSRNPCCVVDNSVIERNIFYNSNGPAVFYSYIHELEAKQLATSKVDHNLYYCKGVEETGTPKFLQDLRDAGVALTDQYAEPMFVSLKPRDFRLRPDSPALKMGIKQIDLKGVGLSSAFPKWLME